MSPESQLAWTKLHWIARGHPGASSGERAAWDIRCNLESGAPVNFADCYVRLDGEGKRAVMQLLLDLAAGRTGLSELGG